MVETPQRLILMASGRILEGGGGQGDSFSAGESFSSRYFYRLDGNHFYLFDIAQVAEGLTDAT